jgi:hypothetical protein
MGRKSDTGINGAAPEVLLVAPPEILEIGPWAYEFVGCVEKSRRYPASLEAEAQELGAWFFDAGTVASSSPVDGIHLEDEDDGAIGVALKGLMAKLLQYSELSLSRSKDSAYPATLAWVPMSAPGKNRCPFTPGRD